MRMRGKERARRLQALSDAKKAKEVKQKRLPSGLLPSASAIVHNISSPQAKVNQLLAEITGMLTDMKKSFDGVEEIAQEEPMKAQWDSCFDMAPSLKEGRPSTQEYG